MVMKFSNIITEMSIVELSEAIQKKVISPVEVTLVTLDKIAEQNPELNAYITVNSEYAIEKAKQAEEEIQKGNYKGALHGIPVGLKDLIYTKGIRTTFGAERYRNFIPDYNAEIVDRLEAAGAIIIGKLNMHQFAYGPTGDRSCFGPARNPLNTKKITGGSSSGSGAAVAANMCYGAIGSDTGGSIRIPSSCCGIVGMKPTFGRVSKHGAGVLSWTLDHLGPMTRTVKDNAIMLNYISGYDHKDAFSIHSENEDFTLGIEQGIKGMTIGIPTSFYFDIIEQEVLDVFNQAVDRLKRLGAKVVDVELSHMDELFAAHQTILGTEAYSALQREILEAPDKLDDEVRSRILPGMLTMASDYIQMLKMKHLGFEMFSEALKQVDVIFTPTLCALPTDIEQREIDFNGRKEHVRIFTRLTGPSNITGLPSISVNGGFAPNGLPVGVQFIGAPMQERILYRAAYALEQAK